MSEGRALVYPQALAFGARSLSVPERGNVLCVSALLPFRLTDGEALKPADWYEAISQLGGPQVAPDAMTPLPAAEVLLLGPLPPVVDARRDAFLRCGGAARAFILHRDPAAPEAAWSADANAAIWHEDDNPGGRGGPGDERPPLIVDAERPERPLWLGPTSFDHPVRLRRIGAPDEQSGTGWPRDASPEALHEAHRAFWAPSLHPGDPLVLTGLGAEDLDTALPPYRVSVASARAPDGRWVSEIVRIHCVTLLPAADMGAVIWRAAIEVGDDILCEKVVALVAALEDVNAPARDEQDFAAIAVDRWMNPERTLDDRPLLPAAMAAAVQSIFAKPPDGDPLTERQAAAEEWMKQEMGLGSDNPFTAAPDDAEFVNQVQQATEGEETPDLNEIGDIATAALATSQKRHEEAGLKRPEREDSRAPESRGERLDTEIERRLSGPYQTHHELTIREQIRANASDSMDADDLLRKLGDARALSPDPPLFWPALPEDEAARFGEKFQERLAQADPDRHVDVSGAVIGPASDILSGEPADRRLISNRRIEALLAEETVWRDVEFENCQLLNASFASARFENCEFRDCLFEEVNLSHATLENSRFQDCQFLNLQCQEPVWIECRFENCTLTGVSLSSASVRDLEFRGGSWQDVQWSQGLMVRVALREMELDTVTWAMTHAPHTCFENCKMFKVWVLAKGFPGSEFKGVEATTSGFLSTCHFDETRFERTRFVETGFTNAVFKDAHFAPGCRFEACDLSGAVFENARLGEVRFLNCSMATSQWSDTDANGAWFLGSILRGVDFADTRLAQAVFTDADIDGTVFEPDNTIGADFRGTVRPD